MGAGASIIDGNSPSTLKKQLSERLNVSKLEKIEHEKNHGKGNVKQFAMRQAAKRLKRTLSEANVDKEGGINNGKSKSLSNIKGMLLVTNTGPGYLNHISGVKSYSTIDADNQEEDITRLTSNSSSDFNQILYGGKGRGRTTSEVRFQDQEGDRDRDLQDKASPSPSPSEPYGPAHVLVPVPGAGAGPTANNETVQSSLVPALKNNNNNNMGSRARPAPLILDATSTHSTSSIVSEDNDDDNSKNNDNDESDGKRANKAFKHSLAHQDSLRDGVTTRMSTYSALDTCMDGCMAILSFSRSLRVCYVFSFY